MLPVCLTYPRSDSGFFKIFFFFGALRFLLLEMNLLFLILAHFMWAHLYVLSQRALDLVTGFNCSQRWLLMCIFFEGFILFIQSTFTYAQIHSTVISRWNVSVDTYVTVFYFMRLTFLFCFMPLFLWFSSTEKGTAFLNAMTHSLCHCNELFVSFSVQNQKKQDTNKKENRHGDLQ